jgi:hypothetical protein
MPLNENALLSLSFDWRNEDVKFREKVKRCERGAALKARWTLVVTVFMLVTTEILETALCSHEVSEDAANVEAQMRVGEEQTRFMIELAFGKCTRRDLGDPAVTTSSNTIIFILHHMSLTFCYELITVFARVLTRVIAVPKSKTLLETCRTLGRLTLCPHLTCNRVQLVATAD